MNFNEVRVGQEVKSICNPNPVYKVIKVKPRGGWVEIMCIDEGFRDMRFNVRAWVLQLF